MKSTSTKPGTSAPGDLLAVEQFADWMPLADNAYRRLAVAFGALDHDDWTRSTPCEGWTVRDLGGHLVGAMRAAAGFREMMSQQRQISSRVKTTGENLTDVMTAVQIERTAGLRPEEVAAEMQALVEPAVRGRARLPGFLRRRIKFPVEIGSISETWTLEYLNGCILTRDAWLHRIDLCDAIGSTPTLDEADGRIVGDVAVEWVRRHGQPVKLTLTGPAGGSLTAGNGGPELSIDAVEFGRVVSGRTAHDHPLMTQEVPF